MRVNVYTNLDENLLPTGAPDDECANVELIECYPGPENGDGYLLALIELPSSAASIIQRMASIGSISMSTVPRPPEPILAASLTGPSSDCSPRG